MKVVVYLLRHRGATLADREQPRLEGLMQTEASNVGGSVTRRLVLRAFGSSPGMGRLAELFDVRLVRVEWWGMVLRGLEAVPTDDGTAAVLQEWRVEISGAPAPSPSTARSGSMLEAAAEQA